MKETQERYEEEMSGQGRKEGKCSVCVVVDDVNVTKGLTDQ